MIKSGPSKCLSTIIEDKKAIFDKERAISVSPVKGSHGGPKIELSSQEESMIKESQDIDWELIQKEDDHVSETTEMEVDENKSANKEVNGNSTADNDGKNELIEETPDPTTIEATVVDDVGGSGEALLFGTVNLLLHNLLITIFKERNMMIGQPGRRSSRARG